MSCPHHGGVTTEPLCGLQKLANHTLNVTHARAPRVAVLVLLVDLDDPSHQALGSDLKADHAARLLESIVRDLRRLPK